MSHFTTVETEFSSLKYLIEALVRSGFDEGVIETHSVPQTLYGYEGDARAETAHVIIRRNSVGGSSNDIGFIKQPNGNYKAIISEFDLNSGGRNPLARETGGYNERFMGRLLAMYAEISSVAELKAQGCDVEIIHNNDGTTQVVGKRTTQGGRLMKFGKQVKKKAKGLFA